MCASGRVAAVAIAVLAAAVPLPGQQWPFETADLTGRDELVILVFGDGGTGEASQYRVGHAMAEVCRRRGCDLALMLGDKLYGNGIEVTARSDVAASRQEILA